MLQPAHAITGRRPMTPERVVGIGFVVALHFVAIWAIVMGLAPRLFHTQPPKDITLIIHPTPPPKPENPQPLKTHHPMEHTAITDHPVVTTKPIEDIPEPLPPVAGDTRPLEPPLADTPAAAIGSTHSTPDYPALARHMGWEGRVVLHLTISPQGIVTAAGVVQSSGYSDLDQAAVSWVMEHWRYSPATHDGSPVASQTNAAVVFNLRIAG